MLYNISWVPDSIPPLLLIRRMLSASKLRLSLWVTMIILCPCAFFLAKLNESYLSLSNKIDEPLFVVSIKTIGWLIEKKYPRVL